MIRFCSDMKASANTSVTGVCGSTSCLGGPTSTSLTLRIANSAAGAGILLSTFSGLYRNKPLAAKPALIFLGMNAFILAGLYRAVKYSLQPLRQVSAKKNLRVLTTIFYSTRLGVMVRIRVLLDDTTSLWKRPKRSIAHSLYTSLVSV